MPNEQEIKAARVPAFKTLLAMDANAFYDEGRGANCAQSRYLCYYLQEQGLLTKFYPEFQAQQKDDPNGVKSLQKILAESDLDAFKVRWEKYVMNLRPGF
ncbi:MAG: hypothetical protein QOJ88_1778 [Pyrinomonadaceae bacterium]|nr:hypothetical protein [Pyrinomonadaceae bacterium]